LIVAMERGLLLDLLATGERERVDGAHDEFVAALVAPTNRPVDEVGSAR
jgi:hypothetical protein